MTPNKEIPIEPVPVLVDGKTYQISSVTLRRRCDAEGCEKSAMVEVVAKFDENPEASRWMCREHFAALMAEVSPKP